MQSPLMAVAAGLRRVQARCFATAPADAARQLQEIALASRISKIPQLKRVVSTSMSPFAGKRGRPHGAPYRQVKGEVTPTRAVPPHILRPPYAMGLGVPSTYPEPEIQDARGMARMRAAGRVAAAVLARAGELVQPGITTDAIDRFVHEYTIALGAYPSPLGYAGFPKSVCASVNEVVCHGIPEADCVLRPGDVVKLDVSCYVDGVHGDTCRTFVVGGLPALDAAGQHLVTCTKAALDSSIALCAPGVPFDVIGRHIHALCDREQLGSVREFAGHGIGSVFHTNPIVYHHRDAGASRYRMRPGQCFTIEPMVTEGSPAVVQWPDGWTIVTQDGGRCAQFEHTLMVTEHGVEVLTAYE